MPSKKSKRTLRFGTVDPDPPARTPRKRKLTGGQVSTNIRAAIRSGKAAEYLLSIGLDSKTLSNYGVGAEDLLLWGAPESELPKLGYSEGAIARAKEAL